MNNTYLNNDEDEQQKDIVPLADMAFILLVFFLIITLLGSFVLLGNNFGTVDSPAGEEANITNLPEVDYAATKQNRPNMLIITFVFQDGAPQCYLLDFDFPTVSDLEAEIAALDGNAAAIASLHSRYGPFTNFWVNDIQTQLNTALEDSITNRANEIVGQGMSPDIYIKADEQVCYGWITNIFEICQTQLNIKNINFEVKATRIL